MRRKPQGLLTPISAPSPEADPATAYARDVVAGKIVAGELTLAAAKRHRQDLKDGPRRGLHWRPEKAAHALGFFPAMLTITEGAAVGRPFHLLPWQAFVVGSLFGWRRDSGRMRFRSGWIETGKGQGKSPLMAGVGLYMLGWYGIPRSKVFAIGQDRATANVLFKDAAALCRAPIPGPEEEQLRETLESRGDVVIRGEHDNAWKIECPVTGSVFQALANNEATSGPRPTLVNVDEVHELKSDAAIETWKRAGSKMHTDSLMLLGTNTPSSSQIVGTTYSDQSQVLTPDGHRGLFGVDARLYPDHVALKVIDHDDLVPGLVFPIPGEDEATHPGAAAPPSDPMNSRLSNMKLPLGLLPQRRFRLLRSKPDDSTHRRRLHLPTDRT